MVTRRRARRIGIVLVGAVALGACSTDEYTTAEAQRDLVEVGYTPAQARCVLSGLHDHYAEQYKTLQRKQGIDQINPKEVELYVRNLFAGQDKVRNDEVTLAKQVVERCRA